MGKRFDELAKALASGVSRREAIRRFAVGALGGALAAVIPGRGANAAPDECLASCESNTGRDLGDCLAKCHACGSAGGTFHVVNNAPFCA